MSPSAVQQPESIGELNSAAVDRNIAETAHSIAPASATTAASALPELDASKLHRNLSSAPRAVPDRNSPEVWSMATCTDHMVTARWTAENGWEAPELKAYGPLSLMPTASCLHYATECFEGMKVYRGFDGKLRLFRPDKNCERMVMSSSRIALPAFDPRELQKLIEALVAQDGNKWLPVSQAGQFLYIRPTMIASAPALGVQRPREALLYVILCLFPSFDEPTGTQPPVAGEAQKKPGLKLLASRDDMVRAWPGGFGFAKVGANYGPSLIAQAEAKQRGYDQILWLFGSNAEVTEAGASNFFVVWRTREGALQLVTAPLEDKVILDGVTRRSVLQLARERLTKTWEGDGIKIEGLDIVERKYTMAEVDEAIAEGRLVEAFAAGTAFFIAPVSEIHFRGKDLDIPLAAGTSGHYAALLKNWLKNIMYGKERHEWGIVVEEAA